MIKNIKLYSYKDKQSIGMNMYTKMFMQSYKGKYQNNFANVYYVSKYKNYWTDQLAQLISVKYRKTIADDILSGNFDLIHITSFGYFFYYILKNLLEQNISSKIVITMHDPIQHSSKTLFKKIRSLIAQFYTDKMFSLLKSERNLYIHVHSKSLIKKRFTSYPNLIIEPHPISIRNLTFKSRENNTNSKNKHNILFIGSLRYNKGIDLLIDVIKHSNFTNVQFTIAGKSEFYIDTKYLKNTIFIDEFIPDNKYNELINNCDLVVLPYRDATASGILSDAYAFNKPVIISPVGSLPDYVIHEKTGLIMNNTSSDELSKTINRYLEIKDYVDFQSNIIEFKKQFDIETITSNIIKKVDINE